MPRAQELEQKILPDEPEAFRQARPLFCNNRNMQQGRELFQQWVRI